MQHVYLSEGRRCAHHDVSIALRTPGHEAWLHWAFTTGEGLRKA